jgi:serine/threonine-protein kinase
MAEILGKKYQIIREIARSNDVVYEATDITTGRKIALKELVISAALVGNERRERIERFNREARATARLSHPNIVTIYGYGEDNGRYYIAMEFLNGNNMRDILKARGALPVREAIDITCQILSALEHAHSRKVIHRDIKPENIYILPDKTVKLTDFGIARLTEEASVTASGQIFGTPSYMSPEQIKGGDVDHRTDIFSTGVMLYEMLSGRKPFQGDSIASITYSIMNNTAPPLSGFPGELEHAVFRALDKNPSNRYPDAASMKRDLKTADLSISMNPQSMAQQSLYSANSLSGSFGQIAPPSASYPSAGMSPVVPPPVIYPSAGMPLSSLQAGAGSSIPGSNNGVPYSGPFATWGAPGSPGVNPGAAQPPPIPAQYHSRYMSMPEPLKNMLIALAIAVVIAGVLLGLVVLFSQSYDHSQQMQAGEILLQQYNQGVSFLNSGQYSQAADIFSKLYEHNPDSDIGKLSRTALAKSWNSLGVNAYQQRDYSSAEDYWNKTISLYPAAEQAWLNADDQKALQDAEYNLQQVSSSTDSLAPFDTQPQQPDVLSQQEQKANLDLKNGDTAWNAGDYPTAQTEWERAMQDAPGTPAAVMAQQRLQQVIPSN